MSDSTQPKLVHQAFLYDSEDHFVAEMVPFVREGIERGETIFAATSGPNVAALREELGDDASRVRLEDNAEWEIRPYERLQAFSKMIAELPEGGSLRAMGEPVWDGSDAMIRQWARYESILNLALERAPMRFVCLYDSGALPDGILDYAGQTHPPRVEGGGAIDSEHFIPAADYDSGPPLPLPARAVELPLDPGQFRRELTAFMIDAEQSPRRAEDFTLAANEVLANALRHGESPVGAHVWVEDGGVVCRVVDAGPGIGDPLAGWLPPQGLTEGGWGLPIARQLCDALEIAPGQDVGAVVTLHSAIRG
jgi:anti-sigma regulatory factor (Ser/Thr protein kinase)